MKKLEPKSVEKKLQDLIDEYKLGGKLSIEKIKGWIFNDDGDSAMDASNRFSKKLLDYFSDFDIGDNFERIFQIIVDAWNAFPHRSLKGRSPQQVVEEELKKNPKLANKNQKKMPEVIVGGRKMSWKEYETMLDEMHKRQKPFKDFIEKEIIPSYKKFLEDQDFPKELKERQVMVAERFFDRVLWVGFINYETIRLEFAKYEFPKWWQTHVMFSRLDENQVWSALRHLITFIKVSYDLEMKGV